MFGEYIVSYIDNEKISKFLISKDSTDSEFIIFLTANNNTIISQSIKDFYLPLNHYMLHLANLHKQIYNFHKNC